MIVFHICCFIFKKARQFIVSLRARTSINVNIQPANRAVDYIVEALILVSSLHKRVYINSCIYVTVYWLSLSIYLLRHKSTVEGMILDNLFIRIQFYQNSFIYLEFTQFEYRRYILNLYQFMSRIANDKTFTTFP